MICHKSIDFMSFLILLFIKVSWGSRIRRLYLCIELRPRPCNVCHRKKTKQPDGEASVQKLWGIWNISSLPWLPGPLWTPYAVRVLFIGRIELASDGNVSNGNAWVLEVWGMWSTPSLILLPGLLYLEMISLQRGKTPSPNECPGFDTKQSDGEVPAVLELWGMRSTPSLPSLPGPLWPGVVAPDRALSMG